MNNADLDDFRPRRRRRVLPLVVAGVVVIGGGGLAAYLLTRPGPQPPKPEYCSAEGKDGIANLDQEQALNASTIAAVGVRRGLPKQAVAIALATAMQESKLINLPDGDLDSAGLFQQRPSQGWGTHAQVTDPVHASNAFYDRLVKISGYTTMPLTKAAQEVQRSGAPDAYAEHEHDAQVLAGSLTGREPASLLCRVNSVGYDGSAAATGSALVREFGGAAAPRASGARLSMVAVNSTQGGWAVAQWSVAHAQSLHVSEVVYGTKVWRASASRSGWRPLPKGETHTEVHVALAGPKPAKKQG